jgi:nucleolar protein 56
VIFIKAYVVTNVMGVFALDREGKVVAYKLFPKKPEEIAERLKESRKGDIIEEERFVLNKLRLAGYKEVIWDKKAKDGFIACVYDPDHRGKEIAKNEFRKLAMDTRFATTQAELNEILTKVNTLLTKEEVSRIKSDKVIMHVIGIIDDLDDSLNSLSERLREWYGMYSPETVRDVKSHEKLVEMLSKSADGEVKGFSKSLHEFYRTRDSLSKYLEGACNQTIPNLSEVAGPLLASRLLSLAGGLEKMAKLPSSTVQLLGAEKALFRHLKGGGKPPKYGILFGHPLIQNAPKPLKGKVARLVAAKISLAAKMDQYSDKDEGKRIRKDLEKRVKELLEK